MTLCPIALAVGCQKCALFSVCPLKTVVGDYKKPVDDHATESEAQTKKAQGDEKG